MSWPRVHDDVPQLGTPLTCHVWRRCPRAVDWRRDCRNTKDRTSVARQVFVGEGVWLDKDQHSVFFVALIWRLQGWLWDEH